MEPLSDRLRRIVAREAEANQPPDQARERNWNAVAAALGLPPGGGPPPSDGGGGAAPAAAGTATKSAALKWVIGAAVVGAGIAGVATDRDGAPPPPRHAASTMKVHAEAPEPALGPTEAPIEVPPEVLPSPPEPSPTPPVVADPPTQPRKREEPEPEPLRGLAEEVALVERARTALESGDHHRALTLTREHARMFGDGELVPDRLNLEATALCASGRLQEGRALLEELQLRWPRAPVTRRARKACRDEEP